MSQCDKYYLSLVYIYIRKINWIEWTIILSCINSCDGHELWNLSIVISTSHNWKLLIARPHRPLRFKKIRTNSTATFLISNTVVPNPYSHRAAFAPHSSPRLLKFQVHLVNNDIRYCENSSWSRIFRNKSVAHGHYIRCATSILI